MSAGSILLRLLLSLCLVLNGTAAAAAHLPVLAEAAAATQRTAGTEAMPCHGSQHEAVSDAGKHAPAGHLAASGHDEPAQPDHGKHSPDCCKGGTCRCACVHIAQVGVPVLQLTAALAHEPSLGSLALGHTAPALPDPIRPPIR